ncbi:MBL fold metallo-hydrolase [Inquilinus sp. CAU 1745]|uniref:MBL fold metallo-hydrolase n=1 Tax=Inquilinus sp. CAU 1745 TaxID=3140369 RepID=UPI00325BCB22
MRVTLLGTGCPAVHPRRYGAATLLRSARGTILIDCGSGATQRLVSAGSSGRDLDAVLLTHLHSDHLVDLYQLILSSWHQGRDRPQRIYGPPGTRAHVDGLMALWREERELRIAHEKRPSIEALTVEVTEIAAGKTLEIAGVAVRVVPVDHRPIRHAYGFVFEEEGRKVAISGDTRYCPELIAAAGGADLLVHEVFIHREMKPVPGIRTAETIEATASYHTLSGEVGRVAGEAGAKALALTHFVPPEFDRPALLAEVRRAYRGPILIGEDLMTIDVAAGTAIHGETHIAFG